MTPEENAAAASQREALGAFSSHPDTLLLSADRLALLLNSLIVGTFLLLLYVWLRVQEPNDLPLSVNGREFTLDVANQTEYQDLIDAN